MPISTEIELLRAKIARLQKELLELEACVDDKEEADD